eukprot:gnl/TRDRNA2_/TRDRNA2_33810_c0_seq1.p1 gnl/TRDRNA2_/TRDRNA2_33810_c0~~gnl/TRDRNA2_/TRDRNA2_33810_c0_seq1.p1  ORF type:complete len:368 (+),score=35.78 gnl/TRDRNA2_/TRDRNA2_33810_c0_seq1:78-1106(+)
MGISQAARDTIASLAQHTSELEFVMHVGDLGYAEGREDIWNEWLRLIEPVAQTVPWDVIPGNHELLPGDSHYECGVPMLARFETPSAQAAFSGLHTGKGCDSFNAVEGDPFWYAVNVGHARLVTYSTDSNYSKGSKQYEWLRRELSMANRPEKRAVRPWLLLFGHKPMYCASTYAGEIGTRERGGSAGEGTEGSLTAELEDLFVKNKVDVSFYGHIHSYNRMFPVKNNGAAVANGSSHVYRDPEMPVHMMVGMAGAPHLGTPYEKPIWSAYSEIAFGWLKATFANSSALHLEFIANGDGLNYGDAGTLGGYNPKVHDEVWITKRVSTFPGMGPQSAEAYLTS